MKQVDRTRPAMQSATRYVIAASHDAVIRFYDVADRESDAVAELGEVLV